MLVFAASIFLGAYLIFQVQPFIGKYILPWFGGTPAVWSTCMLFFQTLLLGGYLYAHLLATRFKPRTQALIHAGILGLALTVILLQWGVWGTPILPGDGFKPEDSTAPVARLLLLLGLSVGLPYFILSSTGPLVQAWFARVHPQRSPYRLYVLSNVGSLLALVSYPFLVEPHLALKVQADMWAWSYGLFAAGMGICAIRLWQHARRPPPAAAAPAPAGEPTDDTPPTWGRRLLWLGLAASASAMLLAATNQICQEVAVIPFLWVLPLTLYLTSFIFTFAGDRWYNRKFWGIAFLAATVLTCAALYEGFRLSIQGQVAVYSFALFTLCMVAHGEMVRLRPAPRYLTSFYLMMSAGGALGGAFVSLLAPVLFTGFWELHLSLWVAWALFFLVLSREEGSWVNQPGLAALKKATAGLLVLLAGVLYGHTHYAEADVIFSQRNFYGVLRVRQMDWEDRSMRAYKLSHGAIVHGFQYAAPARRLQPASYYGADSGIALALRHYPAFVKERTGRTTMRVGVVGLGVGTLATFGDGDDVFRFYEINPSVTALSQGDDPLFTYLRDSSAAVEVIEGDARISMERELREGDPQHFDVLAVDAFSSDSIPAHLLTREAFRLYVRHLTHGGVLAMHISNRHLDLRPVVVRLAELEELHAAIIESSGDDEGHWGSTWVLVTRNQAFLDLPAIAGNTSDTPLGLRADVWTDDYSNLYQILD